MAHARSMPGSARPRAKPGNKTAPFYLVYCEMCMLGKGG